MPSVLLLQIERTSRALVDLNTLLHSELSHQIDCLDGEEREAAFVPQYRPFDAIRALVRVETRRGGLFDTIIKYFPRLFSSDTDPLAEYLKHARRRSEFGPVENVMLELRGSMALIEAARRLPPMLHSYSKKEVLSGESGTAVILK